MAYSNCCNNSVIFTQGPAGESVTDNYMLIGVQNTNIRLVLNTPEIIEFDEIRYENGTTIEASVPTTQVLLEGNHTYFVTYKAAGQPQGLVETEMRAGMLLNNNILEYTVGRVHVVSSAPTIELENSFLITTTVNSTLSIFIEALGPGNINYTDVYVTVVQIR